MKIFGTAMLFSIFIIGATPLNAQNTISFSGLTWNVRVGSGGPGPNQWSDGAESVWVDADGALHLKVQSAGKTWTCAEVYAQESFGFGEYRFYVASNPELYDPNIVAGLFTYEDDTREIDIEFSKWGSTSNPSGWYTVQPAPYTSENQYSYTLGLEGDYSTHKFIWTSDSIFFQSYHGHYATSAESPGLINQFTYYGPNIPPTGNERLHFNLWLFQGMMPTNNEAHELIIKAVFVPGQVGVNDRSAAVSKLYPNPSVGALHLVSSAPQSWTMYSSEGAVVATFFVKDHLQMDASAYPQGMYFLRSERGEYLKWVKCD